MRLIANAAGFALVLTAFPALAEDVKPNDAQIAISPTRRERSTLKQRNWRSRSPRTRRCGTSRRTWFATTQRSTTRR